MYTTLLYEIPFMENLLARITYVIVSLNDILVSGKNNVEHPRNIEEVLKWMSNVFMVPGVMYCGHKVISVKANIWSIRKEWRS